MSMPDNNMIVQSSRNNVSYKKISNLEEITESTHNKDNIINSSYILLTTNNNNYKVKSNVISSVLLHNTSNEIDKIKQEIENIKNDINSGGGSGGNVNPDNPPTPAKTTQYHMWIVDEDNLDKIVDVNYSLINENAIQYSIVSNTSYPFKKGNVYNTYNVIQSLFYDNSDDIDLSNSNLYLIIPCKGENDQNVYVDKNSKWLQINGMTLQTVFPFQISNINTQYNIYHNTKYNTNENVTIKYAIFHIANTINDGQNIRIS